MLEDKAKSVCGGDDEAVQDVETVGTVAPSLHVAPFSILWTLVDSGTKEDVETVGNLAPFPVVARFSIVWTLEIELRLEGGR